MLNFKLLSSFPVFLWSLSHAWGWAYACVWLDGLVGVEKWTLGRVAHGHSQVQLGPGSVSGSVLQGKLQPVLVGSSLSGGLVGFSLGFLLYYKHEIGAWWWERNLHEEHSGAIPVKKEACVPQLFTLLILLEGDVLRLHFCTMLYICKVLQKTLIKHVSFFSFSPALAFLSLLLSIPYSFSPSQILSDKCKCFQAFGDSLVRAPWWVVVTVGTRRGWGILPCKMWQIKTSWKAAEFLKLKCHSE